MPDITRGPGGKSDLGLKPDSPVTGGATLDQGTSAPLGRLTCGSLLGVLAQGALTRPHLGPVNAHFTDDKTEALRASPLP